MDWKKKHELQRQKVEALLKPRGIEYPECGFHVGDGWLPIVEEALDKMIAAGWDKQLDQVKQKFCGLRIYTGIASDEVRKIIAKAEAKANIACEHCGQPHGLEIPRGGIALCPACEAKDMAAIKLNLQYKKGPTE